MPLTWALPACLPSPGGVPSTSPELALLQGEDRLRGRACLARPALQFPSPMLICRVPRARELLWLGHDCRVSFCNRFWLKKKKKEEKGRWLNHQVNTSHGCGAESVRTALNTCYKYSSHLLSSPVCRGGNRRSEMFGDLPTVSARGRWSRGPRDLCPADCCSDASPRTNHQNLRLPWSSGLVPRAGPARRVASYHLLNTQPGSRCHLPCPRA